MFEDKLSNFLNRELAKINDHIPEHRVTLKEAMNEGAEYIARDGVKYYINRNEVELLIKICPKSKWESLFLPIIILRKRELGAGTYVLGGEIIDEYVIARILELTKEEWRDYIKHRKRDFYLYKPHVMKLRRLLPTATTIAFI